MYRESFYITKPVWNNAFSFDKRTNKKLYVPSLIEIDDLDKIELQPHPNPLFHSNFEDSRASTPVSVILKEREYKVAFEDYGFDDKLSTNYWLKNFYKISWENKDIYLFDNHNHAYFFWYLARSEWIIWDNNTLIHIDEHADTRDSGEYLLKPDSFDLEKVFDFTNNVLNVGDYILPAQKEWIIWDIIQIRNETNLLDYLEIKDNLSWDIILNIDLDFFQPDLDYIDYELKKKVVLDAVLKASIITVSTSPFFINQELALNVFKDIFWWFFNK